MKSKVAIEKSSSYEKEHIDGAMDRLLESLGGIEKFIKPGEKVVIKPNLLSARTPNEAVDTHPAVVRAVVRKIKAITPNVSIGDSSGGVGSNIDQIHETSGMKKIAEEENVALARFEKSVEKNNYPLASDIAEADRVVSLPKFKTHELMLVTGAVKNSYGIVPGIAKTRLHARFPRALDFAPVIVDVYSLRAPDLTIVDAIESMDGDGPARGRVRKTGFLIASDDAVAIDSVLMKVIGLKPHDLLTNKEAHKRSLGQTDMERIEVLGEGIDDVRVRDFKLPRMMLLGRIPKSLTRILKLLVGFKIEIDNRECLRCNLCQEACPVEAISVTERKSSVDYSRCLLCLCCREICPHKAVSLKKSFLVRIFSR